ncbi:MAG: histidinol-phosphatase [Candidatus Delongbacteria bacterium]|nr:histidinol-phosphatase [Candidatus Delongbacteria bacterium]
MNNLHNYHTHCSFCDGQQPPEATVRYAIRIGMTTLGFSSHAPLGFETDWTMKPERLPDYMAEIKRLAQQYRSSIRILLGLEIDYTRHLDCPPAQLPERSALDYQIGSVHFLGKNHDGFYWTVDGSPDELIQGITDSFHGQIKPAVEYYYELILQMASQNRPDIIAHIDLIKKNNQHNRFFNPDDKWYRDLTASVIRRLAHDHFLLEVNTGGIVRKRCPELYPSPELLKQGLKDGLRLVLNSDAHSSNEINGYFPEAIAILKAIGYRELWQFKDSEKETHQQKESNAIGHWTPIAI